LALSRRKKKRALVVVGAAASVAVTAGLFFAISGAMADRSAPPVSAKVQDYYDKNVAGKTMTVPTTAAARKVAVIGDSYAAPVGVDPKDNYVGLFSDRLGWEPVSFGQGGTGYTNAGDQSQGKSVFLARVPAVIAAKPDVVIVQGSTNDHGAATETQAAAQAVYAALRKGLPKATIVAVGPLSPPDSVPAEIAQTRAGLVAATRAAGVKFIDPTAEKWLQPTDGLFVDGFHPNLKGHQIIAKTLAEDLTSLGVK
jgi:lysophospholipase L1-like esterase